VSRIREDKWYLMLVYIVDDEERFDIAEPTL
jgi:hypothetical protein